ncbi:hypothetical protein VF10_30045, partial [Nostoc linckia z13]
MGRWGNREMGGVWGVWGERELMLLPLLLPSTPANTVRLKGKGERGKVSNTSFTPYPLTPSG